MEVFFDADDDDVIGLLSKQPKELPQASGKCCLCGRSEGFERRFSEFWSCLHCRNAMTLNGTRSDRCYARSKLQPSRLPRKQVIGRGSLA